MNSLANKTPQELQEMIKELDVQITNKLKLIWAKIGKAPDTGDFESPIEEMLYYAIFNAGVVDVRLQYPVGPYRADLAVPEAKLAIEADGAAYHQDKNRDRKRDEYFQSQGWQVLRFTGSQIHRDPEGCGKAVLFAYQRILLNEPVTLDDGTTVTWWHAWENDLI